MCVDQKPQLTNAATQYGSFASLARAHRGANCLLITPVGHRYACASEVVQEFMRICASFQHPWVSKGINEYEWLITTTDSSDSLLMIMGFNFPGYECVVLV